MVAAQMHFALNDDKYFKRMEKSKPEVLYHQFLIVCINFLMITQEQKDRVLAEYENHGSREIAKKVGISRSSVQKILKENGLFRRAGGFDKYNCDDTYFENLDTAGKCYWFGFIMADGNVCNDKLQIGLHEKDKNHLEKFRTEIGYDGPIHIEQKRNGAKLIISRKKIFDDLGKLGCLPQKTHNLTGDIFDSIPEEFMKEFLRGYFDGDGSFSLKEIKLEKYLHVSLVGEKSFLDRFLIEFEKEFGLRLNDPTLDKRTKQTYQASKGISGRRLKLFAGAYCTNLGLDRKLKIINLCL